MATPQPKPSFPRRFFGWFLRHKVASVFIVLFLTLGIYVFGLWLTLQLQVRSERAHYEATKAQLAETFKVFPKTGMSTVAPYDRCSYSSNGAVFGPKYLDCDSGVKVIYTNLSRADAEGITQDVKSSLISRFGKLNENKNAYEPEDLGVYDFKSESISCLYVSSYYDSNFPAASRPASIPTEGSAVYVEVDCGGPAKAEYFPVTTN